jgi:SAM-dependent methyltransferase
MGLDPPPVASCRVLEIGCGTGKNLTSIALTLPGTHCVGIDLSGTQIATARATAEAIGLSNVEFRALNLLDLDDSFGEFDYIIAHGLFSWIPDAVQDGLLAMCQKRLAPRGIVYISYNTYPGWHQRGVVRDMLLYHTREIPNPQARVDRARLFLNFLASAASDQKGALAVTLCKEAEQLAKVDDFYLYHDILEEENRPLYFAEFAARAAGHGLQYVGDAQFHLNLDRFPGHVVEALRAASADLIELEQNVDFLNDRAFRQTLLCHDNLPLPRKASARTVMQMAVSSMAFPVSANPDVTGNSEETFRSFDNSSFTTNSPDIKVAMVILGSASPRAIPFSELWDRVQAHLAGIVAHPRLDVLIGALVKAHLANLVCLHTWSPVLTNEVSERPVASPLARREATAGDHWISTLRHQSFEVSPLERRVLGELDGQHDRAALLASLEHSLSRGEMELPEAEAANLDRRLESALRRFARLGLLLS